MLRQKVKTLEAMISSAPKSSSPPLSTSVPAKRRSPSDDIPPRPHPPPPPRTQKRSISLSSEDQIKLLNQFSQVQHVAYEYTNVPPNPHPAGEPYAAKTSAFLLASHFSPNPALRSLSTDLLECTRDCIDEAIRTADFSPRSLTLARPMPSAALVLDAIHASTLLASWLLVQGRCVECQQTLFSAAKLDGRLSPSHLQPLGSSTQRSVTPATQNFEASAEGPIKTMIPRPVGIADTKNRVGILWQLLCLDYTAAILMGSSVNVSLPWEDCPSEVRVETIWPDFDSNETTCTSIASLFHASRKASPSPSLAPTGSTRAGSPPSSVDPYALRAKSVVLLERAVRLSAQSERGSRPSSPRSPNQASSGHPVVGDATRAAIKETDTAISNVLEQLPTERSIALHPHTLLLCARVRLHETLMSQEHVSQVVWVQSAVAIVRLLDGMRMDDVVRGADLLLAYAWMASYMVLLHERYYVPYHPESEHVARIKSDLDKLKALLDTVGVRMPVIATLFKTSVDQFNALRDRKSASPFATPPPSDNGEVKTEDEHDELVDDD
ncbi:Fungal Zn(2)-Cys(6) binuclear cluster domain [Rhizoctonia solani]|uniref:Fungal Zn(2)-Cys(6) binuclear cluster domain n=1 Tax=Rhizoctonia solani TaxID=456999 RepID=A0A8H8P447_9AGAM|nr:Fungal Zn(2)-Cys(6) binuclear cluster domain [Rhizoctonia solani]QRW23992.1 Fungal Zn(2)-Cys(6) binuclear cluster domain [Rhizoctonia solani]